MSKKDERRKRAHEGKRSFPTQAAAAIVGWERHGLHGLQSYLCPCGDHWHAGHQKKSRNTNGNFSDSSSPE